MSIRSGSAGKDRPAIRNILVTFQFIIATGLVFVSFTVFSQLQYMRSKDKGFKTEGLLLVENVDDMKEHAETFRTLVEQQSIVISSSFCTRTPASNTLVMGTYQNPTTHKNMSIQMFPSDDKYISTLGMHLATGRNFNKNLRSDTNSLILNESAVAAPRPFQPRRHPHQRQPARHRRRKRF